MDFDFEAIVRDRAYALWEDEGRPHGRQEAHWAQACREVRAAMQPAPAPRAAPARAPQAGMQKAAPPKTGRRASRAKSSNGHAAA